MLRFAKILRFLLFLIISLLILVPTAFYLFITSDYGQQKIRAIGQEALSEFLGTAVTIDRLVFTPFSNITLEGVSVDDDYDTPCLKAGEIDARFEFWDFLLNDKIIIDYLTIDSLRLDLYKQRPDAPLNIADIIEKVTKKDPDKPETKFALRLNRLEIHNSRIAYNVLSADSTAGRFNADHIALDDFNLDAFLPRVSNDAYHVIIRKLGFTEQSGFKVDNIALEAELDPASVAVGKLQVALPKSSIMFDDMSYRISGFDDIARIGTGLNAVLAIKRGTHLYLPDFKAFVPRLGDFDYDVELYGKLQGTVDDLRLELDLSDVGGVASTEIAGHVLNVDDIDRLRFDNVKFDIFARQSLISEIINKSPSRPGEVPLRILENLNIAHAEGSIDGTLHDAKFDVDLSSAIAALKAGGSISRPGRSNSYAISLDCGIDSLSLGKITANPDLNQLAGEFTVKATIGGGKFTGEGRGEVRKFDYRGHRYNDISAIGSYDGSLVKANVDISDRYADMDVDLAGTIKSGRYSGDITAHVNRFDPDSLNLGGVLPGMSVSGAINASGDFMSADCFACNVETTDLNIVKRDGKALSFGYFDVYADNMRRDGGLYIESDLIDGFVRGQINPATLAKSMQSIVSTIVPAVAPTVSNIEYTVLHKPNKFDFDLSVSDPQQLCSFFGLPVTILEETGLSGSFDDTDNSLNAVIFVPWIASGNNVIENSALTLDIAGNSGKVYCTTVVPTKKGDMELYAIIKGTEGKFNTYINWQIVRDNPIEGEINFDTQIFRMQGRLAAKVDFEPSTIRFGDDNWTINKSSVTYSDNLLYVNNLRLNTLTQSIGINGVGGADPTDELTVDLHNIQLVNIFETLNIDNALIGGFATGRVEAKGVFSKEPVIEAKGLKVRDIGYNYCTLGDADVDLSLVDGAKKFLFSADVTQANGCESDLNGSIYIPNEELEININANKINVGFMQPFMEAFTSEVGGIASGHAQLKGTFSDLDMTGEIMADSIRIKIDFVNTYYTASDSIHIQPGKIRLNDVTIYDEYGHTALLNGEVGHKYFHDATFDFQVTKARDFLCYDVPEKLNPDWYGRIFGNGSLLVVGKPGIVDIKAVMSSAANSVFTFVLSDTQDAEEYSFIQFRDKTVRRQPDPILESDPTPKSVLQYRAKADETADEVPTAYNIDLNVDITPQAQMILVMDPAAGDRIRAYGEGHMRMIYKSSDNSLSLRGRYVLDKGNYNFTLQDIIIKDFIIKNGSSISFDGDPYAATLNIDAYYPVNANLTDLDESFARDKELNRTNVPVRALLKLTGDMLQPDISFDLEFPTLTEDISRKVHSIVSTEDMMNRQIMYLLAFNRFYTPEYMASTTKGNELFSVASSTIASQISNMLGKLSENWSIAPNLRSDRGDFSDVEVDVALSTSLLNNRLIVNGNLGYRDNATNNNQFIGDFDIEALLNRSGTWRFKAYNRYNDQNYYLRTAQTTQGLGVVYRKDFDDIFGFLKKKNTAAADSVTIKIEDDFTPDSIKTEQQIIIKDTIQ